MANKPPKATVSKIGPYYTHQRPDDRGLHGATPPSNPIIQAPSPLPSHVMTPPAPYQAKPLPAPKGAKPPTKPL